MAIPIVGTVATAAVALVGGGTPRTASIDIGEPTGGQHRALVIWTNAADDSDAITSVTAGGAAMTALGGGGGGTTQQHFPFAIKDPTTDGSGNCALSFAYSGDGTHGGNYWWAVVDDVVDTTPWEDQTSGGATSGNSVTPTSAAVSLSTGDLALCGMQHNFSATCTIVANGATSHLINIPSSKPHCIASRTTSGNFQWTTNSSNGWYLSVIKFPTGESSTSEGAAVSYYNQL